MLKKTFITFFVACLLFLAGGQVQAATNLSLYPLKIDVKEGQTFRVSVSVNPHGVMNYTVKSSIKFPADLVSLQTWTYANDWMPIRKSGYDTLNNTAGTIVRTAGYPEGFDKTTSFGTAVFVAKKSGTGVIEFASDGMALDANNANAYSGGNQVAVTVQAENVKPEVPAVTAPATTVPGEVSPPVGEQAPEQLFEVTLAVDNYQISKIDDLGARVTFMSFGKVPTPVDLTFDILDANSQIVHTEKDNVTVVTEKVLDKKFSDFALPAGKYTLRLTTLYNTSVKDEFTQPFEVAAPKTASVFSWSIITGGFVILLVVIFLAIFLRRRKR